MNTRQVTLDWTDVSCATRYEVMVRQGSTTGTIVDHPTAVTSSQYTTIALTAGKTFYWRVRAWDAKGASAWTGYRSFKVSATARLALDPNVGILPDSGWWTWLP